MAEQTRHHIELSETRASSVQLLSQRFAATCVFARKLRQDGEKLGRSLTQQRFHVLDAFALRDCAQYLDPGPIGRSTAHLPSASPNHVKAARLRLARQLLGQCGLANARLSCDQHEASLTQLGSSQMCTQGVELSRATKQR